MFGNIVFQLKQFTKPFPAPGSWAYNMHVKLYDLSTGGPAEDVDFSINPEQPSEEAVSNGDGGRAGSADNYGSDGTGADSAGDGADRDQ